MTVDARYPLVGLPQPTDSPYAPDGSGGPTFYNGTSSTLATDVTSTVLALNIGDTVPFDVWMKAWQAGVTTNMSVPLLIYSDPTTDARETATYVMVARGGYPWEGVGGLAVQPNLGR